MKKLTLIAWLVAGLLAALGLIAGLPRAYPLLTQPWKISSRDAVATALERFRDLGKPVADPYVVSSPDSDPELELRLDRALRQEGREKLAASPLAKEVTTYRVAVYPAQASGSEWSYRARFSLDGKLLGLQMRVPHDAPGNLLEAAQAKRRADQFLRQEGLDLSKFQAPEVRTHQLQARTDTTLRYRYREQLLGGGFSYGVEVTFAGQRLTGFRNYYDDPQASAIKRDLQPALVLNWVRILAVFILLLIVAVPFLRRYHAGEIGVRHGLHIMAFVFLASALLMALTARGFTQDVQVGIASRRMTSWIFGLQLTVLFFLPVSLLAFLSWSVGESRCRERWSDKLAAFDGLFNRQWKNGTVARSALRGSVLGLVIGAVAVGSALILRQLDVWPLTSFNFGPWWPSASWMGLALLCFSLVFVLHSELFGRLFLLPWAVDRFGTWMGGALVAVISGLVLWSCPLAVSPAAWSFGFSVATAGILVFLFLRYDLLTTVLASLVAHVSTHALPLVATTNSWLQLQGYLALVGAFLPLLLTLRYLTSEEEFVYRWEDVPPHVRRIAERERQKVELETARRIQSSILPDLPPQLAGVELAHTYQPASEVGGDFYDVLALEDGRLALAVGDVAGHGVSSGLVMSMTKSALAVQVTFNPEVAAVFSTLNRMVFGSARRRLLTTLCYILLDPQRRRLEWACAGHLFPYRISPTGKVQALESVAYPLGVRLDLQVKVSATDLERGDQLFLFSDGVVEARAERGDEPFGFKRLEESLARHAQAGPRALRDGVLDDLSRFSGRDRRDDDLTLLVLKVP